MDILDYIQGRINQLRCVDKQFMTTSRDVTRTPAERAAAKDASDEAYARLQELQSVLKCFPKVELKCVLFKKPNMN